MDWLKALLPLCLLGRVASTKFSNVSCTFVFDEVFTKTFCCDPVYVGECVMMEEGCCQDFDQSTLRSYDHLDFATINPSGLVEYSSHLKASKGSLMEVNNVFQLVRVRAKLAAMAVAHLVPPDNYLTDLPQLLGSKFSLTGFQTGRGLHLPLKAGPGSGTPGGVWAAIGRPLQQQIEENQEAILDEDFERMGANATAAQHSFERVILWDQWLRAAETWGPAPEVELYLKACCTERALVGSFLKSESDIAVVGEDSAGVAEFALSKGARVLSAVTTNATAGSQHLGAQPPSVADPAFPTKRLVIPSRAVDDDSLDVLYLSLETGFVSYWAALIEWLPKLRYNGILIANHVLTNPDSAAALYMFAAKEGFKLYLATQKCAVIVAADPRNPNSEIEL